MDKVNIKEKLALFKDYWNPKIVEELNGQYVSWGSGLTQSLLNHPPNASQYVTFDCAYFGMIGGIVFELFVSDIPESPEEADKWAQKVAGVVANLSISNIAN